jgi:hypothetical protein
MFNTYELGELVRVTFDFTDQTTGSPIDPTTVKLSIRSPDGYKRTYTYGSDTIQTVAPDGTTSTPGGGINFITKDNVGDYHADINASLAGTWYYYPHSTGTGQAADEKFFTIRTPHAA